MKIASVAEVKARLSSYLKAEVIHDHCPGVALYRLNP
jgi:hypothetical protein